MITTQYLLQVLLVAAAPEPTNAPAPTLVDAQAPSNADSDASSESYAQALEHVQSLNERINLGEAVQDELLDALAELNAFTPSLANDPDALSARTLAQLNLARSHLTQGDRELAERIMDEVIRSNIGVELEVDELGPSIANLHAERLERFEERGRASIAVTCQLDCQIYINERPAQARTNELYLGTYRVWVEARGPDSRGERIVRVVNLEAPDQVETLELERDLPPVVVEPPPEPPPERLVSRSAEVALIVVGFSTLAAGSLLAGINPSHSKPQLGFGAAMSVLGGSALVGGAVTLTIDETRIGRHEGRQAVVSWKMRF